MRLYRYLSFHCSVSVNLSGGVTGAILTSILTEVAYTSSVWRRGRTTCNQSRWLPWWASTTICGSGGIGKVKSREENEEGWGWLGVCVCWWRGGREEVSNPEMILCYRSTRCWSTIVKYWLIPLASFPLALTFLISLVRGALGTRLLPDNLELWSYGHLGALGSTALFFVVTSQWHHCVVQM